MDKCPPIVCPPIYEYYDCYIPREVPIIQPIVRVQRRIIVNVPRYYVQPENREEVIDPGCPTTPRRR
ncbi:hypothetical protein [Tumebacillus flagellatus]|uniref:Spore coat protein D n=1 Tax=Tumebacillus flagellatus TaxID=1157490 RepID=A0A074LQ85_9BACL|nr:hypothetical protein [Tumebacillus flagellatus]KEO83264.1 hypothetical protein EL26_11275 [Tumebacillus flagellatus]